MLMLVETFRLCRRLELGAVSRFCRGVLEIVLGLTLASCTAVCFVSVCMYVCFLFWCPEVGLEFVFS